MKKRHTFRRGRYRPSKPKPGLAMASVTKPIRPAQLRHIAPLPPPLVNGRKRYWFHPELTTGFGSRDGLLYPIEAPRLVDVLALCPLQVTLSQHDEAAITGLWVLPDNPPQQIPDFVVRDARTAVAADDAYVLLGRDEAVLREVTIRLCHRLGAVVIDDTS